MRDVGSRSRVADAVALAVVVVVAALAFVAHFDGNARRAAGDSYYYLTQALEFAGEPADRAREQAGEVVCGELHRVHLRDPRNVDCVRYEANPPARYVAIFTSRPGWPLLVSPFAALLGVWRGAVACVFALAVLAAVLVHAALRRVCGPVAAASGAVAFSLLPTGYWASWVLPEGAVLAATALALLGATMLLQGSRSGPPLVLLAVAFTYACKPANGAAVSAALLAAGLVLVVVPGRRPEAAVLAASGALALAGWQVVSRLLGLPSLEDTLQDLATSHYRLPDVPDPYVKLGELDRLLWGEQLDRWLGLPEPLVLVLAAGVVAVVALRRAGLVWALVALSAVGIVALHPLISQYGRLMAPVWLGVCAGIAGVVALAGRLLPPPWRDLLELRDPARER